MLDSGAFSVRFSGHTVELSDYIQFCKDHPEVSYYVNLDSIPGERGAVNPYTGAASAKGRTESELDAHCQKSWQNYMAMIKILPIEKVIPVIHRGENWKWLEKYLDFGSPYIGVGGAGLGGPQDQRRFLDVFKSFVLGSDGKPKVLTHGFAVTGHLLVKAFPWHSVDSATWTKAAGFGHVFIPTIRQGKYRYDGAPIVMGTSPRSAFTNDKGKHLDVLPPLERAKILGYFSDLGMKEGKYRLIDVEKGYKLQSDERWFNSEKTKIFKIEEYGVVTCHRRRYYVNATYMQRMNRDTLVNHVYLAGTESGIPEGMESRFYNRLMSYYRVRGVKTSCYRNFRFHLDLVAGSKSHAG